jgi:hypothetical protein
VVSKQCAARLPVIAYLSGGAEGRGALTEDFEDLLQQRREILVLV